ncbi:MAG: helix-turn-helix domain-containing protein [Candidatus Kerfeldbacteria bacterium]
MVNKEVVPRQNNQYLSTVEAASLLGMSRIAVYKKIKRGEIPAQRVGRNFVILKTDLGGIHNRTVTEEQKATIRDAVRCTVKEYGEALRLLGSE